MIDYNHDSEDYEANELRAQVIFERQYKARLSRHPNCQDPDHPGCKLCDPDLLDDSDWKGEFY